MHSQRIVYVAGPEAHREQAGSAAAAQGLAEPALLQRRGTALGWIAARHRPTTIRAEAVARAWRASQAFLLPGLVQARLAEHRQHIHQALHLAAQVAAGDDPSELLGRFPYRERTEPRFELLAAFQDEGDDQEIETLEYEALGGAGVVAENLWCKVSWLSFEEDDASLRFRFSFGLAGYQDVAADLRRELYAARLCEAIFPESAILSRDPGLQAVLRILLGSERLAYVERIVYFNAPNGGAQFHQDVERGHEGVVFAQIHGRTGWLACAKARLMDEIQGFVGNPGHTEILQELLPDPCGREELARRCADRLLLSDWLEQNDNEPLEMLLNRCPAFCRRLVERGCGHLLEPGDVLLLPQKSLDQCAWHSVFCLDDYPGESLSFAVRELTAD
jgi:hypothetical protein